MAAVGTRLPPPTRMSDPLTDQRSRLVEAFGRDRRRLTRFVERRLFGDGGGDADDIVADVVLRLFERADLLAQVEDVSAYLYRSLTHAVIDFFRRRRPTEDLAAVDPPDGGPDPEEALAASERRGQLCRALAGLSPAERAVWRAVEVDGWSFRALSERWGEPLGTLLARKARATRRLRAALDGLASGLHQRTLPQL